MKNCSKCNESKDLTEFYKAKSNPDGLKYKCKSCIRSYQREYQSEYRNDYPEKIKSRKKIDYNRFPEKRIAWTIVNGAIRNGTLIRGSCVRCGSTPAQGHHEDYSKPLDVTWLCQKHHTERHYEIKQETTALFFGVSHD